MGETRKIQSEVMILGAGASGFGACHELTRNGISVVVADGNPGFGGTAVYGGVSCFEPGVSLPGVHQAIADRLQWEGTGQVQKSVPSRLLFAQEKCPETFEEPLLSQGCPWGLSVGCGDTYEATLRRSRSLCDTPSLWRRFMTDEEALGETMNRLVSQYSEFCTGLFGYRYLACKSDGGRIVSVTVSDGTDTVEISANLFLDCTGSIVLARDAGCNYAVGSADGDLSKVNGASVVFRVSRDKAKQISIRTECDIREWEETVLEHVVSCFNLYPNGDINVNMLPTLTGEELLKLGKDAYSVGVARALRYWEYMQEHYGLSDYVVTKVFRLGIREDYRLVGRHVLSYEDICQGVLPGKDYIAIADHPLDRHGTDGGCKELEAPYGIPLECTMPREFENLFVVCRGSSFSSEAASSARLTRTMMSMGEGVARHIIGKGGCGNQ